MEYINLYMEEALSDRQSVFHLYKLKLWTVQFPIITRLKNKNLGHFHVHSLHISDSNKTEKNIAGSSVWLWFQLLEQIKI